MQVKFYDLKQQYQEIKTEINAVVQKVFDQGLFYEGPFLEDFEASFAEKHEAKYCVSVSSGTAALHATLLALDIGYGDEVIVPSNSFFATAEAVSLTGATPVMVDCKPDGLLDPNLLVKAVNEKTKAVLPVHLYGQAADLEAIKVITEQHQLFLIEDCAQAHLTQYAEKPVGTFGIAGCFSFFPGKNLGAYGEGGAILTNDEKLAVELRKIRAHGSALKYHHDRIGHHYRLESLQAAILGVKLKHLDQWTTKRRENAAYYKKLLKNLPVELPSERAGNFHVYHLYVIRSKERDALKALLEQCGVETGIHYPIPIHLQKAYAFLGYSPGDLPVSEQLSKEVLSLPISEQTSFEQIEFVASKIAEFYKSKQR